MERLTYPGTKEAKSNVTTRQVLDKLAEYEDLEDRLNGISAQQVVDGFVKTIENQTCEGYEHGRILTNAEANQWNEYRQLDEQGLLLRLPCKVGDAVYSLDRFCGGSLDCPSRPCKECPDYQLEIYEGKFALKDIPEFGKTIFLTQEEAEQKLKEMNTDNGITE